MMQNSLGQVHIRRTFAFFVHCTFVPLCIYSITTYITRTRIIHLLTPIHTIITTQWLRWGPFTAATQE